MIDVQEIRELRAGLLSINPDVSHRATEPPSPSEIYTPDHHISALDPDNPLVVGIRGAGKSFWAGTLGDKDGRAVAAAAYPKLNSTDMLSPMVSLVSRGPEIHRRPRRFSGMHPMLMRRDYFGALWFFAHLHK